MLLNLLVGLPIILFCLTLQATFVTLCLRRYVYFKKAHLKTEQPMKEMLLLATVLLLMLLGNLAQMTTWAVLFMLLGEFTDFASAFYFSCVNFTTLGYGDIVMSTQWRLLGPIEAANGILMFGVSTAVLTATVADTVRRHEQWGKPNHSG